MINPQNPHRLAYIALAGALLFSLLLWRSATAQSTMLVRLWHDQDGSATVTAADEPAAGVEIVVTEQCSGNVCAASPAAYVTVTDSAGYAQLALVDGTEYTVSAPCMTVAVQASAVSGQAVQEWSTCGVRKVWLAVVRR